MKIFGIGTDMVSIVRIKKSIKNKRFVSRVYNVKEISKCKKLIKSEHCFAKRFAAKEALSKALGTGISNGINLIRCNRINHSIISICASSHVFVISSF